MASHTLALMTGSQTLASLQLQQQRLHLCQLRHMKTRPFDEGLF
jgi:hypothetical protein